MLPYAELQRRMHHCTTPQISLLQHCQTFQEQSSLLRKSCIKRNKIIDQYFKNPGLTRDFLFLAVYILISLLFTLLPVVLGMIALYYYITIERKRSNPKKAIKPGKLFKTSVLLVGLSLIIFGIVNLYLNKFKELFIQ